MSRAWSNSRATDARNLVEEQPVAAGRPSVTAIRVLIAEDEAIIAMLLAEMLVEMGYEVCAIAATEADAIAGAIRYRPNLMIVDGQLGAGSGVSAVEEILLTAQIPHIFITGNISKIRALRPDAVVLEKPFHEAELTRAIQRAIGPKAAV